jgi:hypothetical protein
MQVMCTVIVCALLLVKDDHVSETSITQSLLHEKHALRDVQQAGHRSKYDMTMRSLRPS